MYRRTKNKGNNKNYKRAKGIDEDIWDGRVRVLSRQIEKVKSFIFNAFWF